MAAPTHPIAWNSGLPAEQIPRTRGRGRESSPSQEGPVLFGFPSLQEARQLGPDGTLTQDKDYYKLDTACSPEPAFLISEANPSDVSPEHACGVGITGEGVSPQPVEAAAIIISTVTDQQNQNVPGSEMLCGSGERPAVCSLQRLSHLLVHTTVILSVATASLSVCLILQYFYRPPVQRACPDYLETCAPSLSCPLAEGANPCPAIRPPSNGTPGHEYRNPVLLVTGSSVLRLYSVSAGSYYTVCHQGWETSHGWTVCRELGFNSHTESSSVQLAAASDPGCLDAFAMVNKTSGSPRSLEKFLTPVVTCPTQEGVSLQCTDCGRPAAGSHRIVGGSPSAWGRWPWQISLQWDGRHVCGGSVISSQWVMTAAHCFVLSSYLAVSRWRVHAGSATLHSSTSHSVQSIYYHGLFSHETNDYDIALLKTSLPVGFSDTLRPVCLPRYRQEFQATGNCWISGWGHVSEGGQLSPVLREAKVHLISSQTCNHSSHYPGLVSPRMLCAGHLDGKADSCQGDSGGPLVCQDGGLWWQVGIVSWGEGCGRPNRPGVYTNLTALLDWVYHRLQMDSEILRHL
ncbi:transmembrane protease serine 5-like [Ascaphus truei]|uniref:transmembrane protease serine 5-like n=1 Tax=Ascaphus truei TaxID=8439 RepID=UPI003F597250